ncbi:MAG: endonuclease/exonuclease/phosphatase family protein [Lautropia sp.]|nr:endonuclease/exonuclease/phosphatase family protein [Lautropia sp.]
MGFWLLAAGVAALAVVTVLPILRLEHWLVRSHDFPRLQYAGAALLLLLTQYLALDWSWRQSWVLAAVTSACLLYQAFWIFPYTRLHRKEARSVTAQDADAILRIMSVNVLMPNRNADQLLRIIRQAQPDFLITAETDLWWQERLDVLEKEYPHSIKCPLENLYGMHLYSRFPLKDAAIQYLVEPGIPSIHASIQLPCGREVKLHCLHPRPPSPTENPGSTQRDAELIAVAGKVAEAENRSPVIVAGDLNDVAWSATTCLFRKISGLLDPRVGRGMFNTFHASYPFLRWPLDHLFHSNHFGVIGLKRLPGFGSDHFPILVELALVDGLESHQEGLQAEPEDEAWAREKEGSEDVGKEAVHTPDASR